MQVRDVSDKEFLKAVGNSTTIQGLLQALGCKDHARNRDEAKRRIKETGEPALHILTRKRSAIWTDKNDKEFVELVKSVNSVADILKIYGYSGRGRNYDAVNQRIKILKIDTSHFGFTTIKNQKTVPLDDIIVKNLHPNYKSSPLRRRLIAAGIKKNKCEICGIEEWNNSPLQCHLDHVDGNPENNLLTNLRILCPNCHSQTETFAGRNKKLIIK